jgi:hypothetical protein
VRRIQGGATALEAVGQPPRPHDDVPQA